MADGPQLEHGYTRIANTLLEGLLAYPFAGGELRLVLGVIRLTYGWGQKARLLRIKELAKLAGLHPRYARRLLKRLARDRIVERHPISRVRVVIGLNKEFSTWRLRQIPKH